MAVINVPFNVPKALQAAIAVLAVIGSAGTEILQDTTAFLPPGWATAISAGLAVVAGVAGFLKQAEPIIDELTT
jgi:hypothetical protein